MPKPFARTYSPMFDCLLNQPVLVLFAIIFFGIALGSIPVKGLSLGLSGVIFTALAAGHYGLRIPEGVGNLGLVLFVYCVGLGAGNRFFAALASQGSKLAVLTLVIIGAGVVCTCACGSLFGINSSISAGIFAGALTSTPALAAAMETLAGNTSGVSIGYGIAYPFGVVGVVIFVQLVPKLLRYDLRAQENKTEPSCDTAIVSRLIRVTHAHLAGMAIADYDVFDGMGCRITRIAREGRLVPLSAVDTFEVGGEILVVGQGDSIARATALLGDLCEHTYPMDTSKERRELILTSADYAGKSLRELDPVRKDHIVISRVSRLGFTFVPTADTVLERNDVLTVVGRTGSIERFAASIGHRSSALNSTDLLSLGFGLTVGVLLGMVQVGLPGGGGISLGIAGGPLIAALILGHFGRIGPFVGYIPRPTRILLQDLGLVLFLANAGVAGGADLVHTVREYGAAVFLMGIIVTSIPMLAGYVVAMKVFGMNILECLGGICGGMTSTPALGAIAGKTDSQTPVVSYATAYPVALILMTIGAQVIIRTLS